MEKNELFCPKYHSKLKCKNMQKIGLLLLFVIYPLIFTIIYLIFDTPTVSVIIIMYGFSSIYLLFGKKYFYKCTNCDYYEKSNDKL